ncbi:PIN domain-containing protein [Halocatena halophila]|uniref:PIN domain-containing protein n=1 Tax=Halocatena halophila TaxID=2814576 RepID=UPI0038B24E98
MTTCHGLTELTTRHHTHLSVRIRDELEEKGQRIQHPDMMIAGVARSLNAPLVTADSGFERIDGIEIHNHREMF